jgi:G:T-mismatch repair DNA endonuclease (very short patch repair protein)
MASVHTNEIRSKNMSRIKGKNTNLEMLVRRFLDANGFQYSSTIPVSFIFINFENIKLR